MRDLDGRDCPCCERLVLRPAIQVRRWHPIDRALLKFAGVYALVWIGLMILIRL